MAGMARKHNVKKARSTGGYARRLAKRGLNKAPNMPWSHLDGAMSTADISAELKAVARRAESAR